MTIIYNECDRWIEKSVTRITVWHHKACQVMIDVEPEGRILLCDSKRSSGRICIYHPHTNNELFFLLAIKYLILCLNKRLLVGPEYAEMRQDMMTPYDNYIA